MKKKAVLGMGFTIFTFVFLLIPQEKISTSIAESLVFCGKIVIPQLFLYICLSSVVWELGIVENIIFAFPKYGAELSSFFMGILAGFPSGAIISGKLYEKGLITKNRAEYLSTFSNNAGISFVFGYVSSLIGKAGALSVFLCQIILSLAYSVMGRKFLSSEDKESVIIKKSPAPNFSSMVKGLKNAFVNTINVCGFILFFSAFSTSLLSSAPSIFKGLLEMTTGLSSLSEMPFTSRLWYSSLFLGFNGLCVHFQVFSSCSVGVKKYLISKCISAVLFPPMVFIIHEIVLKIIPHIPLF